MKNRVYRVLGLVCMLQTLQACVPVALVAGSAATTGSVASDARSLSTMSADQDAAYQANQRLVSDKTLSDEARVVASVYNHTLLLTGEAPTEALRMQAEARVKDVANIKRVYNQITIGKPIGALQQSDDALLTTNIKARMLGTTDLKSNQFKVITENGTVYLMGLSSHKQADMAAEVARHSTGVKQVVKVVEYLS